jgi:hypothetical protein
LKKFLIDFYLTLLVSFAFSTINLIYSTKFEVLIFKLNSKVKEEQKEFEKIQKQEK